MQNPNLFICFLSKDWMVQVLLEGKVRLMTIVTDPDLIQHHWKPMRQDIKKIYDDYDVEAPFQTRLIWNDCRRANQFGKFTACAT